MRLLVVTSALGGPCRASALAKTSGRAKFAGDIDLPGRARLCRGAG